MSYPTYLVHFNKNHNPKNGQFTFGDGDGDGKLDPRSAYAGKSRKEYIKDMKEQYKSNGYSNFKSGKYARSAADQNQWETKQYNKRVAKIKKNFDKIKDIFNKNGNNIQDVRIQKLARETMKDYRDLRNLDLLLDNDYKVGRMFSISYADMLLGTPKYNKNLDAKAKALVLPMF